MQTQPTHTEAEYAEARKLRDAIYGHNQGDSSWLNCRDNWVADLEWLKERQPKPKDASGTR